MHGISIVQSLLDAVAGDAFKEGVTAVDHICLAVGDLSGISPEELQAAYSLIANGSMFEHTFLEIVTVANSREIRLDFYEGVTSPFSSCRDFTGRMSGDSKNLPQTRH